MNEHRSSFHSSLKWTFLMTWGDRAFGLVFTFLLAAILGPRDFGIVALALIYIALVQLLNEGGIQTAIVQREKLEGEHLDSAFWMNLALCLVLAAISFLLAGWWARVNDVPELEDVVKVLSILLVVQGLTIVPLAIFQREMRFKALAIRETARRGRGRGAGAHARAPGRGRLGARRPAARVRRDAARPPLVDRARGGPASTSRVRTRASSSASRAASSSPTSAASSIGGRTRS